MNVTIKWDDEANVWYAFCDEMGLALESGSYDGLIERIKVASSELMELNHLKGTIILNTESRRFVCV